MVLQQKPLEKADFIVKITGPLIVRLASSNKWKAPLVSWNRTVIVTAYLESPDVSGVQSFPINAGNHQIKRKEIMHCLKISFSSHGKPSISKPS